MLLYMFGLLAAGSKITVSALIPRDPPTTYGSWTSLGCWNDSPVNRTLHWQVGPSDTNTVEKCLDSCTAAGFSLGGIEFGRECFCGNAILYNYGAGTGCNFPCAGNPGEICGGAGAINIYHNGSVPFTVGPAIAVFSYNGYTGYSNDVFEGLCYRDGSFTGGVGTLKFKPVPNIPEENMSVFKCIDGCRSAGYKVAGLEFGQQCWCDYPQQFKVPLGDNRPNSECSIPCTGNATQMCGGAGRLMAYFSSSG